MPLFETITHTYKHIWSDVSTGSWKKYPSPERPDILSIDFLTKEFDQETGILTCTKLIICKANTPSWLQSVMGTSECFFFEITTVDPRNKIMQLRTKNLNFTNILGVEEVCTYTPHPDNAEWTLFTQEAKVTSSLFGIARKMESFCLDRFKSNAHKGRKIMEDAIAKVKQETEDSLASLDQTFLKVKQEAEESLAQFEATLDTIKQEAGDLTSVVLQKTLLEESQEENKNNFGYWQKAKYFTNTKNSLMENNQEEEPMLNSLEKSIFKKSLLSEDSASAIFDFDLKFLSNIHSAKNFI